MNTQQGRLQDSRGKELTESINCCNRKCKIIMKILDKKWLTVKINKRKSPGSKTGQEKWEKAHTHTHTHRD
jgi:hypothetical protein